MATITELANAIDGYVDNRATARDILIDQIKRAARQIRRKENNLRQDIVRVVMTQKLSVIMKLYEGNLLKGWNKGLLLTFINIKLMLKTR